MSQGNPTGTSGIGPEGGQCHGPEGKGVGPKAGRGPGTGRTVSATTRKWGRGAAWATGGGGRFQGPRGGLGGLLGDRTLEGAAALNNDIIAG